MEDIFFRIIEINERAGFFVVPFIAGANAVVFDRQPGGQSGDPASPHFNDQALRYSTGDLRDVWFYREDLEGNIEREYHPGR